MKIKRWLISFLAVSIFLGANLQTIVMAEGLNTESVITHQDTDSSDRLEENCIHNHTDECYSTAEKNLEEASPNDYSSGHMEESIQETIPGTTPGNEVSPPSQECICTEQCTVNHANSDCPICKDDISSCAATKAESIVITRFEELSEEITEQWVTKDSAAENLVLPKELNATDDNGQTILIEKIVWEHEKLNSENQDQERYLFTAKLPEGYVLAEGVAIPTITVIVEGAKGTQILFENGIHYIYDPDYPDHKITLFCMNNKLHWPHHTEDMGDIQVPGYTDGYLTPDDFNSQKDYEECMRRLSKLLYAGYPYNGERLYQIVTNSSEYTPSEAEFNQMLIVPPVLQTAYPYLGHHDFTYADWANNNKEHLDYLRHFVGDAIKLGNSQGTTTNGLTADDIYAMPFYKAAFSIINCNNDTPLEAFQFFYGASYFVTEEEAYNATQNAVWYLLYEYNIPDNDIHVLNSELANVLYTYSERGGLLNYKPSLSDIKLSRDLTFTYNPKDGMWHSDPIRFIEPEEYRGLYRLTLPKGMSALCDNLTYVYGNEEYELVSDHQPTEGEAFGIEAEFVWLEEFKQYSPSPDIEFEGKKFQRMIGAVIHNETLTASIPIASAQIGDVSITKTVVGEPNCPAEFQFEMKLPYHQGISGLYGDMEFNRGVATFSLKAGETKIAHNLPGGAHYVIRELDSQGYHVGSIDSEGNVPISDIQAVTFTNTRLPDLTIAKVVTGAAGDQTKKFNFAIELKDQNGNPVNGEYAYIGSIYPGHENEANKPEDGVLQFIDGKAQIQLSHGQQITIKDLPYQSRYTVTETDQEGYDTTYNKGAKPENALLDEDKSVFVENYKGIMPPKPTGTLSVSKTVTGTDGDMQKEFVFTVKLSDTNINGIYGDMEFKDGVASFTLKHGETKTSYGLPVGVDYSVTESDNDGYTVTSTGSTGTVQSNQTAQAQFINHRDKQEGGICVSKTVSGSGGNISRNFTFTVELSDKGINGAYGEMTFKDGVASFTLKHGESKIASGLPAGVSYIVTESDNAGYTVTSTGNTGIIKTGEILQVMFENYKDSSGGGGSHHDNTQLTVKKVWKLDNGGKPTDYITVVLMRDGREYQTVELNAKNGWEYTWKDLSADYDWSAKEINVPNGFTVTT
ncbi:MAG: DUF5979 domain-containing protein, partial [Erysipelotrichaceae bacterium]|nr:DUF5979 domain-containing protein [Erysipelotrichaceae bacterium]